MYSLFTTSPELMKGWQCPVCGRVMSPLSEVCVWCYNNSASTNITEEVHKSDIGTGYARDVTKKKESK